MTGNLALVVSGLPAGTAAAISVAGPSGLTRTVTATTTLTALPPGSYSITASAVVVAGASWQPASPSRTVAVPAGGTATDTIVYAAPPAPPPVAALDFSIEGVYLTQGTQRLNGSVPLLAGRDGWLRVFVVANTGNDRVPVVRVRLFQNGVLQDTLRVRASGFGTPTSVDESSPSQTWNVRIPTARIRPGLAVLVDVDPDNAIVEGNEANNTFPAGGVPLALDVRTADPFSVRLVPLTVNGRTSSVTTADLPSYLDFLQAVWPVGEMRADVRQTFTPADTSLVLQPFDENGSWGVLLSELMTLRTLDGSSAYYIGIFSPTWSSGILGIAELPGRVAIAPDNRNLRALVLAHEVGHNFGRQHAPCGLVGGADPSFPYAGGVIGSSGFDVPLANATGAVTPGVLKPPTMADLMGYCEFAWVSDFNYTGALQYRTLGGGRLAADERTQPALVVRGRVARGRVQLEPAIELDTRAALPDGAGTHLLEVTDESGRTVYRGRFTPTTVAHVRDYAHFAFAIPLPAGARGRVAAVRVQGPQGTAELRRTAASVALDAQLNTGTPAPAALAVRGARDLRGRREARWDGAAYPFAVVRDARTGQITGFARDGVAALAGPDAELLLSDGVRTRAVRVAVP